MPARLIDSTTASADRGLPRLYLPEEVAEHLRISSRTVKRFIATGKLRVTRFGRSPRISEQDLQEFLREGTCKPKKTVRGSSSLSDVDAGGSFQSTGTTPPLDRQAVFRLAQQTSRRRAPRSTSTRSSTTDPNKTPTHNSRT
ncbi:MAG: helix-turn-helix domain-containing protein [Proteobacteria bacterium]|nr:helix-turn-helix domain-containing protein [Pseudomonadota bacterium]